MNEKKEKLTELTKAMNKTMGDLMSMYGIDLSDISGLSDDELKILRDAAKMYTLAMEVYKIEFETLVDVEEKLDLLIAKMETKNVKTE